MNWVENLHGWVAEIGRVLQPKNMEDWKNLANSGNLKGAEAARRVYEMLQNARRPGAFVLGKARSLPIGLGPAHRGGPRHAAPLHL